MKALKKIILVQFFLHDAMEWEAGGNTTFLGSNGTGKTAMLDAVQIAMLGANLRYLKFNAQTDSSSGGGHSRTLRGYCLGMFKPEQDKAVALRHRRDTANTFITLVFEDSETGESVSAGVAMTASIDYHTHEVQGLFVAPGVELTLADHMETVGTDEVPRLWKDFAAVLRKASEHAGRTPILTDRSETYVRELLHAIGGAGAGINQREFLRTFAKSVSMKDIGPVSDFVRHFLVETPSIDKQRALLQVETLRKLKALIDEVGHRINQLGDFDSGFTSVQGWARRQVAYQGLEQTYKFERASEIADAEAEKARDLGDELQKDDGRLARLVTDLAAASQSREALLLTLNSDEPSRRVDSLQKDLAAVDANRAGEFHFLRRLVGQVVQALNEAALLPELSDRAEQLVVAKDDLVREFDRSSAAGPGCLKEAFRDVVPVLERVSDRMAEIRTQLGSAVDRASTKVDEVVARINAIEKTGVALNPDPAMALELLSRAGIRAKPVCTLIGISKEEWQPAVEGFLKQAREALLVEDGKEDQAVQVLRRLPQHQRLHDARIVQPERIRSKYYADPATKEVASLLTTTDRSDSARTAQAYLRQILSGMVMVETEAELRGNDRAMTVDGMLSANASTGSFKLMPDSQLIMGMKSDVRDASSLPAARIKADAALRDAKASLKAADRVISTIGVLGELSELTAAVTRAAERWGSHDQHHADLDSQIKAINLDHMNDLRDQFTAASDRITDLDNERLAVAARIPQTKDKIERAIALAASQREVARLAKDRVAEIAQLPDFDADFADGLRQEIDEAAKPVGGGYDQCLGLVESRGQNAASRLQSELNKVVPPFIVFIDQFGYGLIEERTDWRLALKWVRTQRKRLVETELVRHEQDAKQAKLAAEQAFRTDIAVKLRNAIDDMKSNLDSLNRILRTCPEFSNGERYLFRYETVREHRDLYEVIKHSASLFELTEDSANPAVLDLLELAANNDPERGPTPLDDFRLMFSFDVEILSGGKHAGWLSQRIGPGSNGEHRTPFYVVLGAALAHAYRLDDRRQAGAGFMLLDEAFYAMDSDNSLAAAQFLKSLGLQLLMTGPSTELAKLMAVSDRIYEFSRFDADLHVEVIYVKAAAKDLMTSDYPSAHPDLLDIAEAEIVAKEAARVDQRSPASA
ncbi:hypothetical protein ED208_15375 [Stagnimonas aquatica]|uniref:AAA family ATPase n=1 Tax=Stagnimonas aquatica TaxID=2689987 RepID=A0A3N0V1R0_9GAMM|nr:SbcC/MukB-like Walker B domain-containing protein [Stagnimonas aquatica]ROH86418.1 hypothetical protein ED208_15375 [Stagnimonas aquatica]